MSKKLNMESIRQLLNRSSVQLDQPALARLRVARTQALERYDARTTVPAFAWAGGWTGFGHSSGSHRNHYYLAIAILLAAFLYSGASYWQHVIEHEKSEIDIAILTDDLPIDAYVD